MPAPPGRLLAPALRVLMRFAGPVGWGLTAYEIWQWTQLQDPENTTKTRITFTPGKISWWSYNPELITYPGEGQAIEIPGGARFTGGPPGLGEVIGALVSAIPSASNARIAEWEANGRMPFVTSRDEIANSAFPAFNAGNLDPITTNLVVGSDVPGVFNSKLMATFRVYKPGAAAVVQNIVVNTPPVLFPEIPNVPFIYGDLPIASPIGQPAFPAQRPVYYGVPRFEPWTPEFPDVGPRPPARPQPAEALQQQTGAVSYTPGQGPKPSAPAGPRPPGKNVKERKAGLPPWASIAWRGASPITESVDAIDAVYEAMPKQLKRDEYNKRGRQPNPLEKLEIMYRNIHKLNIAKAVENLIIEQAEDKVYGKAGQLLRDAALNANPNRPIGWGAGDAF